jgi:hypothetical protein
MFDTFVRMVALLLLVRLLFSVATGDVWCWLLAGFTIYVLFHVTRGFS